MLIDNSKVGRINLLDLVNHTNSTSLLSSDVVFGDRNVIDPSTNDAGHNTEVTVTATESSNYTGSVTIQYTRLELDSFLLFTPFTFQASEGSTAADALDYAVNNLGLMASECELDLDGQTWPTAEQLDNGESFVFYVIPIANSYVYDTSNNRAARIPITVERPKTSMNEAISTSRMNGFEYPADTQGASA